jgi:putative Mg2+ transporter-C (MgtC) family protein
VIGTEAMVLRLVLAALLGGIVGLERERIESAAGLRTHALVAVGSALLMLVSMFGFHDAVHAPEVVLDPSRVAAQIVSGIGFLGAGVIIFRREIIRGLTTAASVWVVAGIGMAVGGGLYLAAIVGTALSLGILAVMKPLERRWTERRRPQVMRVAIDPQRTTAQAIVDRLGALGLHVLRLESRYEGSVGRARLDVVMRHAAPDDVLRAAHALSAEDGVREVRSSVQIPATGANHPGSTDTTS